MLCVSADNVLPLVRSKRLYAAFLIAFCAYAVASLIGQQPQVRAHPLGNFTINRYTRIELSPGAIGLRYVVDMAEIPAFQERAEIDANGNDEVSDLERAAYLDRKGGEYASSLDLVLGGDRIELRPVASELSFPPGQGGLATQRLVIDYTAPLPAGWEQAAQHVEFHDGNYAERIGWREVVVRALDGVRVVESTVPAVSVSDELRAYPEEALSNSLSVDGATFTFEPGGAPSLPSTVASADAAEQERATRGNGDSTLAGYADLIARDRLSFGVIAVALLVAMGFGAIHALSPGHGKTVVAAYLVGSRGTMRHALLLALTVTVTHTSSVYALGFVTLYLSDYILPEDLYPWLGIASGGLILAMGAALFIGRLRTSGLPGEAVRYLRSRLAGAASPRLAFATVSAADQTAVPTANGEHRVHEQMHEATALAAPNIHRHGWGAAHTHHLAGDGAPPLTWRGLIGLGIFGGLLPCPSAIVVMLSAIALHRVAFGLVLIVAFSLGLAGVLSAIGLVLVYAGRVSDRVPLLRSASLRCQNAGGLASYAVRAFPVASAAAVVIAGLAVTARGLAQQGFL
jgi:ABC-type nickel/cobalt efflux system permease component RcnA